MEKMRRMGLVAVLGCLLAPAPVGAHEYEGTTVAVWTYSSSEDRFEGRVGSMVPACERRRTVKLQETDGSEWETVAKTRSNRKGRWHVDMVDAEGTFRVVVPPRSKVTIEHDHQCRRYASPAEEVGEP